ncbi:hypothetical protein PVK06_035000 [Gossypium arboreum]|uniref:Uncharacterized protein n=1 Tax=Gossypium arboreum TaxID=29729 RepID=A0ABR0NG74_GOSAR|nr:hypothetical protein PVK06_035000 [Gossypium arboreum]
MELEDDDDLGTMIAIYYPLEMDNLNPSSCGGLLQTPENLNYDGCSYNILISCPCQEIHPKTFGTIEDSNEGFENEDQSHHDNEYFNDLNLDEIPEDINDESVVEGEDA